MFNRVILINFIANATKIPVFIFCKNCKQIMWKLGSTHDFSICGSRRLFMSDSKSLSKRAMVISDESAKVPHIAEEHQAMESPNDELKRHSFIQYAVNRYKTQTKVLEVPFEAGSEALYTNDVQRVCFPHQHDRLLAQVYYGNTKQLELAIKSALATQGTWSMVPAAERLAIWRRGADIIETDPSKIAATIILGMNKTLREADEDVKRLISLLRSNAEYLEHLANLRFEIHGQVDVFPTFNLRSMDGFVAAMAPFESAALSASLALCPALMGNTVLWNPALECVPASYFIYKAMREAGLPQGVVNFVPTNERLFLDTVTDAVHFSGINYHGAAHTFRTILKKVADKLHHYICFPRLVAECEGKNFHFVHRSAKVDIVAKATVEAAFSFAGQNVNSCSRLYVPSSMWNDLRIALQMEVNNLKVDDPSLPETDCGAVINRDAFLRLKNIIKHAQNSNKLELVCGGECDDTVGFFIKPTIVVVYDPLDPLLSEPIVGPILPVFVYADDSLTEALKLTAHQSKYALCGSIFATKDDVICHALNTLRMSASNLYINERCTGNINGLTPFGGNRLSGTNDKTGSAYFLMRWCSPLLIEETVNNPIAVCKSCHQINCHISTCQCGS